MRVITKAGLQGFWETYPQAGTPLEDWYRVADKARWKSLEDVRRTYPAADLAKVKSGGTVTIFNIGGNKYRLVAAIHCNSQRVYVLHVMTREEYSRNAWKERFQLIKGYPMSTVNQSPAGHPCCRVDSVNEKDPLVVWPLKSEDDYQRALEVVDRLAVKGEEKLTDGERDQLDIFTTLIEAYENVHHAIVLPELPTVEFLKKLMSESGMGASDLGRLLGDRSLGYRILSGERSLSKRHVKILSEHFRMDPSTFLS
ncbi:MAG: type II toxin-antitoxin system HigB family toxin [Pseudomonadota bacterium]